MASILKVDEMQGVTTAGDITITDGTATMKMQSGIAKVWGSVQGSNAAFNDSFNCSSLADNGTGDGTPSFTNSMANTNYAHNLGHRPGSLTSGSSNQRNMHIETIATGSINIINSYTTTGGALIFYDVNHTFSIDGDLA